MYSLFIAEDERIVIEGLTSAINWEDHQIRICGTAADGLDALHQINTLRPDLVMADIRMPGMSGLDLIREAKLVNPELVFLIISGYSEFEYAKRALEMEAVDYLVKPMEVSEILASVRKAIAKIEKQKEESQLNSKLEQFALELEEKQVLDLLLGKKIIRPVSLSRKINEFGVSAILMKAGTERNESLMVQLREQFAGEYIFGIEGSVVIVSGRPAEMREKLIPISEAFHTVIGISLPHNRLNDLSACYEEAKEALKIGVFGNKSLTGYEELKDYGHHQGTRMIQEIQQFFSKRPHDVFIEMNSLIEKTIRYAEEHKLSPQKTKYLCFNLVKQFLNHVEKEYELEEKLFGEGFLLYEKLDSMKSLKETERWLKDTVKEAGDYLDQNRLSFNEKLILELKNYLNEHYSEPIVLDDLGKHFYKSPAYLCSLFSKTAGKTIFEYITIIRMENAKKLLRSTNLKISEICILAGYSNHKYFNQVFKKNVGKTPGQYRSGHLVK